MSEHNIEPNKVIKFSELKAAINMIFDQLEKDLGVDSIKLKHDYYFDIFMVDAFKLPQAHEEWKTPEILLDQLYDDWEFLQNMIKDDSACHPMFEKVAAILRYIASRDFDELNAVFPLAPR